MERWTRRAVWRCFLGIKRSVSSQASMIASRVERGSRVLPLLAFRRHRARQRLTHHSPMHFERARKIANRGILRLRVRLTDLLEQLYFVPLGHSQGSQPAHEQTPSRPPTPSVLRCSLESKCLQRGQNRQSHPICRRVPWRRLSVPRASNPSSWLWRPSRFRRQPSQSHARRHNSPAMRLKRLCRPALPDHHPIPRTSSWLHAGSFDPLR